MAKKGIKDIIKEHPEDIIGMAAAPEAAAPKLVKDVLEAQKETAEAEKKAAKAKEAAAKSQPSGGGGGSSGGGFGGVGGGRFNRVGIWAGLGIVFIFIIIILIGAMVPTARHMLSTQGSFSFGLGELIKQIAGISVVGPVETEKEVKSGPTLATTPFYSFRIDSVEVSPMKGQMFFPGGSVTAKNFDIEKGSTYEVRKAGETILTKTASESITAQAACDSAVNELNGDDNPDNDVTPDDIVVVYSGMYYPCGDDHKIKYISSEGAGQTFSIRVLVRNTGDKEADNMTLVILPKPKDSWCNIGGEDKMLYKLGSGESTEFCDTVYLDESGGYTNFDACAKSFTLEKAGTYFSSCKVKFGCVNNFVGKVSGIFENTGCECDPSAEEGCGWLNNVYTPNVYARLVGPYVSTTRLDIQFMDGDYYDILTNQNLFYPFVRTATNSWGAVTLYLDTASEKQPILSFKSAPMDTFTLRVKYDVPQKKSGRILEPFTENIPGTKSATYGDIQKILNRKNSDVWPWEGDATTTFNKYYKERLYMLIPSTLLFIGTPYENQFKHEGGEFKNSIVINNLVCGDYVYDKLCDQNSDEYKNFISRNLEFKKVADSYCRETAKSNDGEYKGIGYLVCEVYDGKIGNIDYELKEGEEYQFPLHVPNLNGESVNRVTYLIRADLLYYFVYEKDQQNPIVIYSKI